MAFWPLCGGAFAPEAQTCPPLHPRRCYARACARKRPAPDSIIRGIQPGQSIPCPHPRRPCPGPIFRPRPRTVPFFVEIQGQGSPVEPFPVACQGITTPCRHECFSGHSRPQAYFAVIPEFRHAGCFKRVIRRGKISTLDTKRRYGHVEQDHELRARRGRGFRG